MRRFIIGLCLVALAAGCSSGGKATAGPTTASGSTTTVDPKTVFNTIPYEVGGRIGLGNWVITVAKVHRPYSQNGLPPLPSGRQYVALDMNVEHPAAGTQSMDAGAIFTMVSSDGKSHSAVKTSNPDGIDGRYKAGTVRSGQLIYAVPPKLNLVLLLNGPVIGSQRSVWTIDPPTVPAA